MMEVEESEEGFPYWSPARRRFDVDDPLFAAGNIERELLAKQVALDLSEEEKQRVRNLEDEESSKVFCPIVACGAHLKSLEDFEDHYNARHTAACSVCARVYPTSRLLSIHVSEAHDSFFQAKVARGYAMYECLVEGCDLKLKSYKSRQQHLIDKHKFPASFEFFKKAAQPSKKQRQKSHRKQASFKSAEDSNVMQIEEETMQKSHRKQAIFKSEENSNAMQVEEETMQKSQHKQAIFKSEENSNAMQVEEETMNDLVSAVSKMTTSESPSAISFGRHRNRGLTFVPRAVRRDKKPDS